MEARSGQNYQINFLSCIFNFMSFVFDSSVGGIFFVNSKFFSKYALLHTLQLLDTQFNITNSTYKHTL